MRFSLMQALVAGLAIVSASSAAAQIGSSIVPPNNYELTGKNFSIFYSTTSLAGEPQLTLVRASGRQRQFIGDEIRYQETDIGQHVTVVLRQISDLKTISLTVLIPDINLEAGETALFETRAFFTSHLTTIAGPDGVRGPLQTYYVPDLIGVASDVDFLAMETTGVFGKVLQAPTCGGPLRPGDKCIGPLADAEVQLLDASDTVVASGVSDQRGLFGLRAAPGDYTLVVDTDAALPVCEPVAVTISSIIERANIRCDTGIR